MRDVFIGIGELSETLGVHRQTIWRWHKEGRLPPMVHLGPSKRGWWRSTLESVSPVTQSGRNLREKMGLNPKINAQRDNEIFVGHTSTIATKVKVLEHKISILGSSN